MNDILKLIKKNSGSPKTLLEGNVSYVMVSVPGYAKREDG